MSKQIDERVVSMQFDNQHFEKNVHTTMSTLDKLKAKLNFKGATTGLEEVSTAAKNIDMSPLNKSVVAVQNQFSALQVIGVTALANLTNSAVNAGKNIVRSLTITPVTTGFSEYELKMNSIQTIMAGTGEKLETVNRYLNELNEYSDKTKYSFQDMTSNIGKFTNAGVKLEDAVLAMKGISNEAAVSGANANEASRAMYNFAQALSAGYVKLIDWKSIELANMATIEFKEQLIDTAVKMGTLIETSDGLYKTLEGETLNATQNFNDSLQDQWMTSEVLIGTLKNYADETTEIGKKATKAATEVKTFTEMMGALRESAQSGWAQTWEIIFGDYDEGKTLWTSVNNVLSGVVGGIDKARNDILRGAFGDSWDKLITKVEKTGVSVETFEESLKETAREAGIPIDELIEKYGSLRKALTYVTNPIELITKTFKRLSERVTGVNEVTSKSVENLEKLQKITKQVINGDFGNGAERIKKLTEAGYEHNKVQSLVNYIWERNGQTWEDCNITADELVQVIGEMTVEERKAIGITEEQANAFAKLAKEAEESGSSINDLLQDIGKLDGRTMLIESFGNIAEHFKPYLDAIKEVFGDIFTDGRLSDSLYNLIEKFYDFTEALETDENAVKNFKTIIEGLRAAFDLLHASISLSLPFVIKVLTAVFEGLGTDALSVGAAIAEILKKIRDWVKENTILIGTVDKLGDIISNIIRGIKDVIRALLSLDFVSDAVEKVKNKFIELFGVFKGGEADILDNVLVGIKKFFESLVEFINGEKFEEHGRDIVEGLAKGITSSIDIAIDAISKLATLIKERFCELLEINSPSKIFAGFGKWIVIGLVSGIFAMFPEARNTIGELVKAMFEGIYNNIPAIKSFTGNVLGGIFGLLENLFIQLKDLEVDFGTLFVGGVFVSAIILARQFIKVLGKFANPLDKLGDLFKGAKGYLKDLGNARKLEAKANAIKSVALAIGILAASIYVLGKMERKDLIEGVVAIYALVGAILLLSGACKAFGTIETAKLAAFAVGFGFALGVLAVSLKIMAGIDGPNLRNAVTATLFLLAGMGAILAVFGKFVKSKAQQERIKQVGKMFQSMAWAILIMSASIKILGGMDPGDLAQGTLVVAGMLGIFALFLNFTTIKPAKVVALGALALKMGVAIMLIAGAIKMLGGMGETEIAKALIVLAGIGLIFGKLFGLTTKGAYADRAGSMFISISISIGLLAIAIRLLAGIPSDDIAKGLLTIAAIETLFVLYAKALKGLDLGDTKTTGALLSMAGSMILIGLAIKLLANIPLEDVAKGMLVVSAITLLFKALMTVMNGKDILYGPEAGKMLREMSVALLIISASIAILSMLDPKGVAVGVTAVSALMYCFTLILKAAGNAEYAQKSILMIGATIAILAGTIALLSFLDTKKLIASTTSLAVVMGGLALVMNTASSFKLKKGAIQSLVTMVAVIGALGLIIAGLSHITNPDGAIASASAISVLLLALSASMQILGDSKMLKFGANNIKNTIGSLVAMVAVIGALGLIIAGLSHITKPDAAIQTSIAISVLLLALSVSMRIINGSLFKMDMSVGLTLAAMVVVVGLLAVIVGMLANKIKDPDSAIKVAAALSILLLTLTAVTGVLALIGLGAGAAIAGAAALIVVVGLLTAALYGLGKAFDGKNLKTALKNIQNAGKLLSAVCKAIGDIISGFLEAIGEGAMNMLTDMGKGIRKFLSAFDGVDASLVKSVGYVADAILKISAASFIDGIAKLIGLGNDDIGTFGDRLESLGKGLKKFMLSLDGFDVKQIASITAATKVLKQIVKMADEIDGQSWAGKKIFGDNSISSFMNQFTDDVIDIIVNFITRMSGIDLEKAAVATKAVEAVGKIAEASSKIDGQSGLSAFFTGKDGIAAFATKDLVTSAENFVSFINTLSQAKLDDATMTAVNCACDAMVKLAESGTKINGQTDWGKAWFGDNSIATFSEQLPTIATNLSGFVTNLGTMAPEQISSVNSAVGVVNALANLNASNLLKLKNNLPGAGDNLADFGTDLKDFCGNFTGEDAIDATSVSTGMNNIISCVVTGATQIASKSADFAKAGESLVTTLCTTIVDKAGSVTKAAVQIADKLVNGIKGVGDGDGSGTTTKLQKAAKTFIKGLTSGLKEDLTGIDSATAAIANKIVNGVKGIGDGDGSSTKTKMKNAGSDLVQGLVNGLEDPAKLKAVYEAAYELGAQAVKGEKAGQKSKSPSKATFQAGIWLGEGLINGIRKMNRAVYNTAHNMGDNATNSISDAVSSVANVINSDIDAQPTIRPVMDLSDVTAGANQISNLLNESQSVGVMANVGAIQTMMNRKNQNGSNSDVISAIKDLGRSMSDIPRNNYTVNGVTYDDGSAISEAVQTLVRAALIERRV